MKNKILFAFIAIGLIAFSSCDKGEIALITCTDYDGYKYQTVKIGNQTWMAENLQVTHYYDGTAIPHVTDSTAWAWLSNNNTDDAYCFYDNNSSSIYGTLYTWSAAMGDNAVSSNTNPSRVQGICPDGWHLPSDSEWTELTEYLGTSETGGKLKETGTTNWASPNTGATNETGFTALPGGMRTDSHAVFGSMNLYGTWWSATEYQSSLSALQHMLIYDSAEIYHYERNKSFGLSVRCVKD